VSEQEEFKIRHSYAARRRKQERHGQIVVYQYDLLPRPFLVQVVQILERAIGSFEAVHGRSYVSSFGLRELRSFSPHDVWKAINEGTAFAVGEFDIESRERLPRDKFARFLPDAPVSTELKLTAIEYAFRVVESLDQLTDGYKQQYGVLYSPAEAVTRLNYQFGEHDLGYRYVAGEIVRMDAELLHSEVVEPAINLLRGSGFAGPLDELLRAHRHYRRGETADAVVDANNAFESTMKTICEQRGITLAGTETAEQLIKQMTGKIIPPHLATSLQALRQVMQALPTLRNRTPGAGHGGGSKEIVVLNHVAGYALNLVSANILFLVESSQAKDAENAAKEGK
jgi:hypothetical protein